MKSFLAIISLFTISILTSCEPIDPNKQIDEGNIQGNIYTSQEIGWAIEIPSGWEVIKKEQVQANNEKGLKAIEETIEGKVDYSGLKNLIAFKKNQFNIFQSTSEPFEIEYEGEWEEKNAALKEIIYMTYFNQGIKTDSSITTIEKINGLDFQTYSFTIYGPKEEVILKQILYSRLINGYDFGVNINYNNEEDKKVMMDAWRNSKFKK